MASGFRFVLILLSLGLLPLTAQAQGTAIGPGLAVPPGPGLVPPTIGNTPLQRQQRFGAPAALAAPMERIEFQDSVAQSTGRDLPIFGSELFRNVPSTFAPLDNILVTSDYAIGPGDEILIRAWGQLDVDYAAEVDRTGTINIPKVGTINVAGIKYKDLQSDIKTAIGRIFRNFDLTVSLGQLRAIQMFVVGQARRQGFYTVGSP